MKKTKIKKNKKNIICDNKKQLSAIISRLYKAILKLDTKTLHMVSFDIYRELIIREDFNLLDDEITKFQIMADDLRKKGVDITCLI